MGKPHGVSRRIENERPARFVGLTIWVAAGNADFGVPITRDCAKRGEKITDLPDMPASGAVQSSYDFRVEPTTAHDQKQAIVRGARVDANRFSLAYRVDYLRYLSPVTQVSCHQVLGAKRNWQDRR